MAERIQSSTRRRIRRGVHTLEAAAITAAALAGPAAVANAAQSSEATKAETAHVQIVKDTPKGIDLTGNGVVRLGNTDTPLRGTDNKKEFRVVEAQAGNSLRGIVESNLRENRGQAVSKVHVDREVAVVAAASGITNVNRDLQMGQQIAVPDAEYTSALINAGNKRGNLELKKDVLAMNAEISKKGIGPAMDEAREVVSQMGVAKPDLKKGEPGTSTRANELNTYLGVSDQEVKSDISSAEMQRRIDNAKKNGWIETSALDAAHIWDQQKYENGKNVQSDGKTNETSRMAVQITRFDKNVNKDGNFDERKMQEGAKFNEFNEQMDTIMGIVGQMSAREMFDLRDKINDHSVFEKLVQIWAVNQGERVNDDIPNRDVAAASVYLEIAEKIDLKDAPADVIAFINKLQNTPDRDEQIALLLKSPDMVKKLFVNPVTSVTPGTTPDKPGATPRDGTVNSQTREPSSTRSPGSTGTTGPTGNPSSSTTTPVTPTGTPSSGAGVVSPPAGGIDVDWGTLGKVGAGALLLAGLGVVAAKRKEIKEKLVHKKYKEEKVKESLYMRKAEKKPLEDDEIREQYERIYPKTMTWAKEKKLRLHSNIGRPIVLANETSVGMDEDSAIKFLKFAGVDPNSVYYKAAFDEYETYKKAGTEDKYAFVVSARTRLATNAADLKSSKKDRKVTKRPLGYVSFEPRLVEAIDPASLPPQPKRKPRRTPKSPEPQGGTPPPSPTPEPPAPEPQGVVNPPEKVKTDPTDPASIPPAAGGDGGENNRQIIMPNNVNFINVPVGIFPSLPYPQQKEEGAGMGKFPPPKAGEAIPGRIAPPDREEPKQTDPQGKPVDDNDGVDPLVPPVLPPVIPSVIDQPEPEPQSDEERKKKGVRNWIKGKIQSLTDKFDTPSPQSHTLFSTIVGGNIIHTVVNNGNTPSEGGNQRNADDAPKPSEQPSESKEEKKKLRDKLKDAVRGLTEKKQDKEKKEAKDAEGKQAEAKVEEKQADNKDGGEQTGWDRFKNRFSRGRGRKGEESRDDQESPVAKAEEKPTNSAIQ